MDVGFPTVGDHVVRDLLAERFPRRAFLAGESLGDTDTTVDRGPAHHFGVHEVSARAADFPDAVVGLVPATRDRLDQIRHQSPVSARERRAGVEQSIDELHQRPEDVELHLSRRGVADAHGSTARVAGQLGDLRLGAQLLAGQRVDGAELVRRTRAIDDAERPVEELHALRETAE